MMLAPFRRKAYVDLDRLLTLDLAALNAIRDHFLIEHYYQAVEMNPEYVANRILDVFVTICEQGYWRKTSV
jgi:hypothetical protein